MLLGDAVEEVLQAHREAAPERLRGTIESVTPDAVMLKTRDGQTEKVALASEAKVSWVVPASLDHFKDRDALVEAALASAKPVGI